MQKIYPLILCGGIGTRLWPLSRTEHPKQFQRINESAGLTFFHATVDRQRTDAFHDPIVAVSSSHVGTVLRQLEAISCQAQIIAEPLSRNTGPAVLAAALSLVESEPDALMCVFPSDHIVKGDLAGNILEYRAAAQDGHIVLFGVRPDYPETGYGYIVDGGELPDLPGIRKVAHFVEKPVLDVAIGLISAGNCYWSSGISLFRADVLIAEFKRLDPTTYIAVMASLVLAKKTEHAVYLDVGAFAGATNLPTESIVFEHSPLTVVAPLAVAWSDVGAWNALHQIAEKNEDGNVLSGDVICIDSRNSYIRASGKLIAVVGLEDVVVVDTEDALLVTTRGQAQQVKQVVKQLEAIQRRELAQHARSEMSWGEVRRIQKGPGYELRLMTMRAGTTMTFAEDMKFDRMLTIADGSGVFRSNIGTRQINGGESVEILARTTAVIFCGPDQEMQIVEVCCEANIKGPRAIEPALELVSQLGG